MKVIVAGSRSILDKALVHACIESAGYTITELVSGVCAGESVDFLGEVWAIKNNIPIKAFPVTKADWEKYKKAAGHLRNTKMAEYAEAAIIVWDGASPGSKDMMMKMVSFGKPYVLFNDKGKQCIYENGELREV